jgi:hypothetical protein
MAAQSASITPCAVLSALGALSITDSSTATSNTSPNATTKMRLSSLPLPRELRDMIYGYLLDGDHTRIQRTCYQVNQQQSLDGNRTGPKAYHFHTNILAVNHEIHKEAEELLYKRNTFVVISYRWPSFGEERGGTYWVPIVSNEHVDRMKLHSLRIHASPGSLAKAGANTPVESYIILARDMKAFCASMHARLEDTNGVAITVNHLPNMNTELSIAGISEFPPFERLTPSSRMSCQLRDTKYRPMDRALQNYMLAPLATVISMSQKVMFTGSICDSQQISFLKKRMGPTLISPNAIQWHTLAECIVAKEVADAALEHEDLELVVQYYRMIASRSMSTKFGPLVNPHEKHLLMEIMPFCQMIQALDTFTVEIMLILACGELKLGNMARFLRACDHVDNLLDFARIGTDVVYAALTQGIIDRRQSVIRYRYLYEPDRRRHVEPHGTAAEFCKDVFMNGEKGGPLMAHDYQILLRCPDQHTVVSTKHLPLDQCAAVSLPFTTSSYYKEAMDQVKTGNYKGWQNVDFLRTLGSVWQAQIRALQEKLGVEKTDFDTL